jgi:hypothetical protein
MMMSRLWRSRQVNCCRSSVSSLRLLLLLLLLLVLQKTMMYL